MKLKKLLAGMLSGIMAFGMAAALPQTDAQSGIGAAITAEAASTLRRPCDPEHPMLIVHIDTWNVADPAKIIICMRPELSAISAQNLIVPVWMI